MADAALLDLRVLTYLPYYVNVAVTANQVRVVEIDPKYDLDYRFWTESTGDSWEWGVEDPAASDVTASRVEDGDARVASLPEFPPGGSLEIEGGTNGLPATARAAYRYFIQGDDAGSTAQVHCLVTARRPSGRGS